MALPTTRGGKKLDCVARKGHGHWGALETGRHWESLSGVTEVNSHFCLGLPHLPPTLCLRQCGPRACHGVTGCLSPSSVTSSKAFLVSTIVLYPLSPQDLFPCGQPWSEDIKQNPRLVSCRLLIESCASLLCPAVHATCWWLVT